MSSCRGKTALVTNASGAIGRAVARALGEAGAQVLVHHFRAAAMAERLVNSILAAGGKARAIAVDLTSVEGPHELAHRTRAVVGDRLDILVINANAQAAANLHQVTLQAFDKEYAANLRAPLFLVQQLLPAMNQGACLVFCLASVTAPEGDPASSVIRGGLDALVTGLALALRPRGVQVEAFDASGVEQPGRIAVRPTEIARAVTASIAAAARNIP